MDHLSNETLTTSNSTPPPLPKEGPSTTTPLLPSNIPLPESCEGASPCSLFTSNKNLMLGHSVCSHTDVCHSSTNKEANQTASRTKKDGSTCLHLKGSVSSNLSTTSLNKKQEHKYDKSRASKAAHVGKQLKSTKVVKRYMCQYEPAETKPTSKSMSDKSTASNATHISKEPKSTKAKSQNELSMSKPNVSKSTATNAAQDSNELKSTKLKSQNEPSTSKPTVSKSTALNAAQDSKKLKSKLCVSQNEPAKTIPTVSMSSKSTASSAGHISRELDTESIKAEQDVSHNESVKAIVCCSKPGKPRAINITSESIEIEWTKPEQGAKTVNSYKIFYHSASDPDNQWRELIASGAEERVTLSGLTGKSIYYFKVQSVCKDNSHSESDISEPITTLESITLKNVIDRAWEARIKWYRIGLQLEIEASDLDIINKSYEKPDGCFMEMIQQWLHNTGGSWIKLIDALSHKSVGYNKLAKSVAASLGLSATSENQDNPSAGRGK